MVGWCHGGDKVENTKSLLPPADVQPPSRPQPVFCEIQTIFTNTNTNKVCWWLAITTSTCQQPQLVFIFLEESKKLKLPNLIIWNGLNSCSEQIVAEMSKKFQRTRHWQQQCWREIWTFHFSSLKTKISRTPETLGFKPKRTASFCCFWFWCESWSASEA